MKYDMKISQRNPLFCMLIKINKEIRGLDMKYKVTQRTCYSFMIELLNIELRETVSLFLAKLTFF